MSDLLPVKDANFYNSLIDSLPFTVAVIDSNGQIIDTNWQWDRFGVENDLDPSYLGSEANYLNVCENSDDEIAQEAVEGIRQVIRGERDEYTQEYPCHSEDEKLWFIMRVRPFTVDTRTFYLVAHSDITDRVKAENKLRHAEKLASLGEMAAGLMHEINNPNASVRLNAEYLGRAWEKLNEYLDGLDLSESIQSLLDEFSGSIDAIQKGTHRIEDIVDKVNVFAGRSDETEPEKFDPNEAIREALEPLKERGLEDRIINEDFQFPDNQDITLTSDRNEFQQLVTNLVANAFDAVEAVSDPEVCIKTLRKDDNFYLIVRDNGSGIPMEQQRKIFDPFFTTKDPGQGVGLGLSITKGIIDKIDAEVSLDSTTGEGTTFSVSIPIVENH